MVAQGQQGQQALVVAGKARHVRVAQHVGGMLVIVVVGDRQADFVQVGRPAQRMREFMAFGAGLDARFA